mmetsp:Transcript_65228/g.155719  ORF Transcript_65228/g.155719 Transcript_65228/m.155719 type:complete len:261 (+) Transcript_65228:62-844(+)
MQLVGTINSIPLRPVLPKLVKPAAARAMVCIPSTPRVTIVCREVAAVIVHDWPCSTSPAHPRSALPNHSVHRCPSHLIQLPGALTPLFGQGLFLTPLLLLLLPQQLPLPLPRQLHLSSTCQVLHSHLELLSNQQHLAPPLSVDHLLALSHAGGGPGRGDLQVHGQRPVRPLQGRAPGHKAAHVQRGWGRGRLLTQPVRRRVLTQPVGRGGCPRPCEGPSLGRFHGSPQGSNLFKVLDGLLVAQALEVPLQQVLPSLTHSH